MHPILNVATIAAKAAGEFIVSHIENIDKLTISEKENNNFVTQIDTHAERIIIETIQKYYPKHSILAEEGSGLQNDSDFEWIIDPLDGTTNFLHQFPQYSVSIAVREKGRLMHGVVFDPLKDELFCATRGEGARLNNFKIRATQQKTLKHALLATGFPYYQFDNLDEYLASLKTFMTQTAGIRRAGSAALDLAYVAAGRVDGYWEFNLKPWDIAAGALIAQEAGALVIDMEGNDQFLKTGNIIAANPKLIKEMVKVINKNLVRNF